MPNFPFAFSISVNQFGKNQELGLAKKFMTCRSVQKAVRYLLSLAFVPPEQVHIIFNLLDNQLGEILTEAPNLSELYQYFQDNYIGSFRHGQCVKLPKFEIRLWNMVERVKAKLPRTDNKQEAWHKAFAECLNVHNPDLYTCLDAILMEQDRQEIRVSSFKAGKDVSRPTETQYISQNLKLENIVSEYDPKDALGYLKRVAPNVNVKSSFKNHDDEEDN